jgi:hypothetical protein
LGPASADALVLIDFAPPGVDERGAARSQQCFATGLAAGRDGP